MTHTACVVALTTFPAGPGATLLARQLVDERLAACVAVVPGVSTVYRWQGAVTEDAEQQLVIKTTAACVPQLEARLRALHPYDVPEFLVLPVSAGSDAYLKWVGESVGA